MEKSSDQKTEIKELKARLAEAEETLRAIRSGEVDALVVSGLDGDQVFTLKGAEMPYRILVEEMNQGALLVIPDGTILYANSRFAGLSKTPLEQIIGSPWKQFFPPDIYPRIDDDLTTTGLIRPGGELSLQAADGSCRPVQLSLRSMTHGMEGFSIIVTDLSERQQSEHALRKISAELLEKNGELEAFSYSISHDIRTPLRTMQQYARAFLEDYGGKLEPEAKSYLDIIESSSTRLDRLIQDVLAYSQLSRLQNEVATLDLDKIVRDMVTTFPNIREADIQIVASTAQIRGYEVALGQCIANLLGNAIKFVPPGVTPRIRIWAEDKKSKVEERETSAGSSPARDSRPLTLDSPISTLDSDVVRLWVQDNGIGISPEDQIRIFDVFFRGNSHADYEGTGIGLSIVKKAVEKMGGRVGVESELGQGSRFWIDLESAYPNFLNTLPSPQVLPEVFAH